VGYDRDFEGNEGFAGPENENTFLGLFHAFSRFTPAAMIIGGFSILLLILWETGFIKRLPFLSMVPGPLFVVSFGIGLNAYFISAQPDMALQSEHLVALPVASDVSGFLSFLSFPDFSQLVNPDVWTVAITLAIVASLETLLSIEAIDKLDPFKRVTPNNRELLAQGAGNTVSGLLGGLPVTSVIVRSSANVNAGARSKSSAILHGLLMLIEKK
jgi:MFS superfamily sulfate permease-like transporter